MRERKPSPWTPYGLEAYRVALLRRRSRLVALGIAAGTLVVIALLAATLQEDTSVNTFGGGSTVQVDLPSDKPRGKPTTLSVAPGRTAILDKPIQPEARPATPTPGETVQGSGLNWIALLQGFGPPIAGALYAWRVARKRYTGPLEELNLGVYKGALPLEMITAHHRKHVFTREQAHAHLFGKGPGELGLRRPVVVARARTAAFQRLR